MLALASSTRNKQGWEQIPGLPSRFGRDLFQGDKSRCLPHTMPLRLPGHPGALAASGVKGELDRKSLVSGPCWLPPPMASHRLPGDEPRFVAAAFLPAAAQLGFSESPGLGYSLKWVSGVGRGELRLT